jgi:hypothetical protein
MGSDSDGPALAVWYPKPRDYSVYLKASHWRLEEPERRFSFIDVERLTVLKAGSFDLGKLAGANPSDSVSASGGSFMLNPEQGQRRGYKNYVHASAGGDLYETVVLPMQNALFEARGKELWRVAPSGESWGSLALSASGGFRGRVDQSVPFRKQPVFIRSADPAYYLSISGLPENVAGTLGGLGNTDALTQPPGAVTASVHAMGDDTPLLTVHGLDEMALHVKMSAWFYDDLTIDNRFHFVPAAQLLITIPPSNDRLVVRHLDVEEALDRAAGEQPIILSPKLLMAPAGGKLKHQVVARSKKGRVTYALADGPGGLKVAADGMLTWTAPARLKGKEVPVVVTVSEPAGNERFHTIKILVE